MPPLALVIILSNYDNTTTCGHTCVDTGSYTCQSASTYCASSTFSFTGGCNAGNGDAACPIVLIVVFLIVTVQVLLIFVCVVIVLVSIYIMFSYLHRGKLSSFKNVTYEFVLSSLFYVLLFLIIH